MVNKRELRRLAPGPYRQVPGGERFRCLFGIYVRPVRRW